MCRHIKIILLSRGFRTVKQPLSQIAGMSSGSKHLNSLQNNFEKIIPSNPFRYGGVPYQFVSTFGSPLKRFISAFVKSMRSSYRT